MASIPRTIKLLNCLRCGDILRMYRSARMCKCKASQGRYVGAYDVSFSGPARIIGIGSMGYHEAPMTNDVDMSKLKARNWYIVPIASGEVTPGDTGEMG